MKSFQQCGVEYASNLTAQTAWAWHGNTIGFKSAPNSTISLAGCHALCGTGVNILPWEDISSTITTWILPVIGTLLQAPFESNATRRTLLAVARWVGSPIASLSYVLWNIKVSAKAALMVDMAVPYDQTPAAKTDFGSMRDSMYLLLVMNQYTMRPLIAKEAGGLLRIVLFSRDLKLTDTGIPLRKMRRILAAELRETRRRGVVPVFISTMWFLFAFALSVQAALGHLGENATAHDLALGCLLAWFPILILGSIVDRNPVAAETIRKKLNTLIDHVRHSLRDQSNREAFIDSFRHEPNHEKLRVWINNVAHEGEKMEDFFVDFAGQARVRWHYGAAHAILCDIENCYIAKRGRNWLANEKEARASLVLGEVNDQGLMWFDMREFWQITSAVLIVLGSCGAAFIIAFFTPTVGLGCRSGGYLVFFVISMALLIVEMTVWLLTSPLRIDQMNLVVGTRSYVSNINPLEEGMRDGWHRLKRQASSFLISTEDIFIRVVAAIVLLYPWDDKRAVKGKVQAYLDELTRKNRNMSTKRRWEILFFRPLEIFNTLWLVYIVAAQTIGWYKTCNCTTSTWGGGGGYLDFRMQGRVETDWSEWVWVLGTVMASLVMALSMFYITVEWCQQSFLSTESYADAMQGLQRTRLYRHWTYYARRLSRALIKVTIEPIERLGIHFKLLKKQETLLWKRKHTWNPPLILPTKTTIVKNKAALSSRHAASPSIELTDYSTMASPPTPQDTPAMPHSLFPPAISVRRARAEQFSFTPSSGSSSSLSDRNRYRDSDDSSSPLVVRPVDAHHAGSRCSDSPSDEERENSEMLVEAQREQGGLGIRAGSMGQGVMGRQRYKRAGSDAGTEKADVDLERGVSG